MATETPFGPQREQLCLRESLGCFWPLSHDSHLDRLWKQLIAAPLRGASAISRGMAVSSRSGQGSRTWTKRVHVCKTAKIFSKDLILQILQLTKNDSFWLCQETAFAMVPHGNLWWAPMLRATISQVWRCASEWWVNYDQTKQQEEVKENGFLIPVHRDQFENCFASRVILDLHEPTRSLPNIEPSDLLFYKCLKGNKGLGQQPMGQHYLGNLGKAAANKFGLRDPDHYTDLPLCYHCLAEETLGLAGSSRSRLRSTQMRQRTSSNRWLKSSQDQLQWQCVM